MMNRKDCYSVLDRVFPRAGCGQRQVPPECFECQDRVECLKVALQTEEGLEMRTQLLMRAEQSGLVGTLQRWSQKKHMARSLTGKKRRS